jgi:hypothetical protein
MVPPRVAPSGRPAAERKEMSLCLVSSALTEDGGSKDTPCFHYMAT